MPTPFLGGLIFNFSLGFEMISEHRIVVFSVVTSKIKPGNPQNSAEFWGLPGLILEVTTENTTILCSEIISNPKEKLKISPPKKGVGINIKDYRKTIMDKMLEMRNNMGRRRG